MTVTGEPTAPAPGPPAAGDAPTAIPVALHHVLDGRPDAAPLLLGGSLGTTTAMWAQQVAPLAAHHRLIRFDHRGHGRSPEPPAPYAIADLGGDVLALMDALGIERASYCGLSIGGMVGMWLAANVPERIDRLVLLCTSAHLPPADGWRARAEAVRAAGSVDAVAVAVLARWVTPSYARTHPERVTELRAMLAASPPAGYAACCEAIAAMDLRPSLGRIAASTLIVAGADDAATPPDHARTIAAAIPGARLELLSPMAHLGNVEQPERVTQLILDHLDPREQTQ